MRRISLSPVGLAALSSLMLVPATFRVLATTKLETQAQPEVETFFGTVLRSGENFSV
jgi:hypothetical protein